MALLKDNAAVTEAAVDALIARFDEPAWLAEERRAALRTYAATPHPTPRDEVWRYTQLERFAIDGLELVDGPRDASVVDRVSMRIVDSDAEASLVIKNGEVVQRAGGVGERGSCSPTCGPPCASTRPWCASTCTPSSTPP